MSWSKLGGWRELGVSFSKGSELGGWRELGASWSELEGWRELGASWSEESNLGGWRELGVSWRELGVSWSEGSELEGRGVSFNLLPPCPLPPCHQRWWGPQYILSCSLAFGSELRTSLSELGVSWSELE